MFVQDEIIEDKVFTQDDLAREYDNCTFNRCTFTGLDLSSISFSECEMSGCDLSNVSLYSCSLKDVKFKDSKLMGLHFEDCNPLLLEVSFHTCDLRFSSLYQLKLKGTAFVDCKLESVDFSEADLSKVKFDNCQMLNATFNRTICKETDFRTAIAYQIDPAENTLTKARFGSQNLEGLLAHLPIRID